MPYKDPEEAKRFRKKYYLEHREEKIQQAKEYYINNREKRDRQKKEWDLKNRIKMREFRKQYYSVYNKTDKGKKIIRESKKKWILNNQNKSRCHQEVRNALNRGDIIKPKSCTECGAIVKLHGHHSDYNKPLAVEWLCPLCHKQKHKEK